MKTKSVTQLDEFGYFLGTSIAYESPLEPGVFHIPANAIDVKPPTVPANKRARWMGEWVFEDVEDKADNSKLIIPKTKSEKSLEIINDHMFFTNNYYWNRFTSFEKQEFTEWFDKLHEISANPEYSGDVPEKPLFMLSLDNLTPDDLAMRNKKIKNHHVQELLSNSHHFETPSHRRYFEDDNQYKEFEEWRHQLHDVIQYDKDIPITPKFINELLGLENDRKK